MALANLVNNMSDFGFLDTLVTKYRDIFEKAVANNYVVCIPTEASLGLQPITKRLVTDHILKPSPYIENLFQTLSGKNLLIKSDEIEAHTGYTHKFTLKIIREENAHDENGRVYKQITINAPLDDNPKKFAYIPPDPIFKFYTSDQYIGYLTNAVEGAEAASMFAKAFTQHFNTSYIIFKEFAKDCYAKVKTGLKDLKALVLTIGQFQSVHTCPKWMEYLCEMVESNILKSIYPKLFGHMKEFHEDKETELWNDCNKLIEQLPPENFGFDPELKDCQFKESFGLVEQLNDLETPWEKLQIITRVASTIDKECKHHLSSIKSQKADSWETSADQYFPLLTYFICLHKPKNLLANLAYIQEFTISTNSSGEKTYHLINFQAAVQSIKKMVEDVSKPQVVKIPSPPPPEYTRMKTYGKARTDLEAQNIEEDYGVFGPPRRRI